MDIAIDTKACANALLVTPAMRVKSNAAKNFAMNTVIVKAYKNWQMTTQNV